MARSGTVTILYTDLVGSTTVLDRLGDEAGGRVLSTHRAIVTEQVRLNGGEDVKWLGDGLMAAFDSTVGAMRCALAVRAAARKPVRGERLGMRVGLHVGEVLREDDDYTGLNVVIARRLCDRAAAGQVLCSRLVADLVEPRGEFSFRELGDLELKGISRRVAAMEALSPEADPTAVLSTTPFVGRDMEVDRLNDAWTKARNGAGGLVLVSGEPGIGKSRLLEEFERTVTRGGGIVLRGHCDDGIGRPYGPFAEALTVCYDKVDVSGLDDECRANAAVLARIAPALGEALPELTAPFALSPAEEQFRLLDAAGQFLVGLSRESPVALLVDDLHWADSGTLAMLRQVARVTPRSRLLVVGAYRDTDLGRGHPLAETLAQLQRSPGYERVRLLGLTNEAVAELLEISGEQAPDVGFAEAITSETEGNPFFIKEVLFHLVEEGKLVRDGGRWTSTAATMAALGIPEGIRQVVGRRLARLSEPANRLLAAASVFDRPFRFDAAAGAMELAQGAALDALDEALLAQLVKPGAELDRYEFTHALIRASLYTELNASRQIRLHRKVAEGLRGIAPAQEVAYHYRRSAALPGAEAGLEYAISAADEAESAYSRDAVVAALRTALELLPKEDGRQLALRRRLALALPYIGEAAEAKKLTLEVARGMAAAEGQAPALEFAAESMWHLGVCGFGSTAEGIAVEVEPWLDPDRRDITWVRVTGAVLNSQDRQSHLPGQRQPSRDRVRALIEAFLSGGLLKAGGFPIPLDHMTRKEIDTLIDQDSEGVFGAIIDGRHRPLLTRWLAQEPEYRRTGRRPYLIAARSALQLGEVELADRMLSEGRELLFRFPTMLSELTALDFERAQHQDSAWEAYAARARSQVQRVGDSQVGDAFSRTQLAATRSGTVLMLARLGRTASALGALQRALPAIEELSSTADNYGMVV